MKKTLLYVSILLLSGSAVLYSCKKDNKDDKVTPDTDTQTAKDNSLADKTFDDVQTMADQAYVAGNGGTLTSYRLQEQNTLLSACATITITPGVSDTTITIDFGPAFCHCTDGRFRKGQVIVTFTGRYRDSATVITHTFNNYYVGTDSTANTYHVQGTKTVTNLGHNAAGHLNFSVHVNGSLTNHSGQVMTWNSQRNREWIAGESTLVWLDDEYKITGSANGTNFNGLYYTLTITQALHIALNCWWIKDGKFEFTPTGRATRYVDYGTGTCDGLATVTINGYSFSITLY